MNLKSGRVFIFLAVLAVLFVWSGCCLESGDSGGSSYSPTDIRISISDTTATIDTLCYPQIRKCMNAVYTDSPYFHKDYYGLDYDLGGMLLISFNETIIEFTLSNGQTETVHFTYKPTTVEEECTKPRVEFSELKLVSTTLSKYSFNSVNHLYIEAY